MHYPVDFKKILFAYNMRIYSMYFKIREPKITKRSDSMDSNYVYLFQLKMLNIVISLVLINLIYY